MRVFPGGTARRLEDSIGPTSLRLPVIVSIQNTKWTSRRMLASLFGNEGEWFGSLQGGKEPKWREQSSTWFCSVFS